MAKDKSKRKKMDVKMLVEAEDRRKKWDDTSITGEKDMKRQTNTKWVRYND